MPVRAPFPYGGRPVKAQKTTSPRNISTGNFVPTAATDGTDTTPAVTETYFAEIIVPLPVLVKGIAVLNGSLVAGNIILSIADAAGANLGATASTAQAGAAGYQKVDLVTPLALKPGTYYVLLQCNNVGARFRSLAVGTFGANKKTGETYGTFTTITPPVAFTASLGPIASLY